MGCVAGWPTGTASGERDVRRAQRQMDSVRIRLEAEGDQGAVAWGLGAGDGGWGLGVWRAVDGRHHFASPEASFVVGAKGGHTPPAAGVDGGSRH